MAPWINRQLEVNIYSNVPQNAKIGNNQAVFRYDLRAQYNRKQQAFKSERNCQKNNLNKASDYHERLEKGERNGENILSTLFKRGDRIKIQQGYGSTTGVYIRSNNHLLVWADEKGNLSTSSIDHIIISKL